MGLSSNMQILQDTEGAFVVDLWFGCLGKLPVRQDGDATIA